MSILSCLYGFAITLLLFSLCLFTFFMRNSVYRFRRHPDTRERLRSQKLGRDAGMFFGGLFFFFAGFSSLNIAFFLQSYRTFAIGEPIARVIILPGDADDTFKVQIQELGTKVNDNSTPQRQEFFLKGDRWTLEGNIVRFNPWISFLGVEPVYQLTRLQGGYFKYDDEVTKERTVYSLINRPTENWWKVAFEHGDLLPFVNIAHGSAVTQSMKEGYRFDVSVLPSGFTVERTVE